MRDPTLSLWATFETIRSSLDWWEELLCKTCLTNQASAPRKQQTAAQSPRGYPALAIVSFSLPLGVERIR